MKKFYIIAAALCALSSCTALKEEWEPVVTFGYEDGAAFVPVDMDAQVNCTIAELKALYVKHGRPVQIVPGSISGLNGDIIIKGEVTTSDEDGNVYREIYIQDATGGLDLKLGRSSSYDDYKVGQILYVKCNDLVLGEYGYKSGNYGGSGLLQLGCVGDGWREYLDGTSSVIPEYETAYIDLPIIIKQHIFRGRILPEEERIKPVDNLKGSDLTKDANVSKLVRLNKVWYGNSEGGTETFCLFYPDPSLNHSKNEAWNRVFLSSPLNESRNGDFTFGIKTWALTKYRFHELAASGVWDDVEIGEASLGTVGTAMTRESDFGYVDSYKNVILAHPGAQSVSHYFMYDGVEVQVRTSGYSRFADVEIPASVRNKEVALDLVGILTRYQGSAQFTILDVYYHGNDISILK